MEHFESLFVHPLFSSVWNYRRAAGGKSKLVIRGSSQQSKSPINLFGQNYSRKLVRQSHPRKRQPEVGAPSDLLTHARESPDHESQPFGPGLLAFDNELGELRRVEFASFLVQERHEIVAFDRGDQVPALRGDHTLFIGARLDFQLAHFAVSEAFDPFQIICDKRDAGAVSGLADPNEV